MKFNSFTVAYDGANDLGQSHESFLCYVLLELNKLVTGSEIVSFFITRLGEKSLKRAAVDS